MIFLGSTDAQNKVFPQDKVVPVGSDITFCFVTQDEVTSAQISYAKYPLIHLDGENVAIKVHNISVSISSGTNVVFMTSKDMYGTVIFAGCKYKIYILKPFLLINQFLPFESLNAFSGVGG